MKQNFFHRYLSAKVLPIWTILLIDIFIIVASCLLAYSLRYDFRSIFLDSSTIDKTILWTVVANLIFFRVFRTYSNVLRFSSFVDIMRIFVSLTVSYGVLMILSLLLDAYLGIRIGAISVLFMAYVINFAMMACSRIVVKMFFEVLNFDGSHTTNVFIYGAKEAGETMMVCTSRSFMFSINASSFGKTFAPIITLPISSGSSAMKPRRR